MATLTQKDTSEVYKTRSGERELSSQRTRSFKTFAKGRQRRVAGQIGAIHYRLDPFSDSEEFKEIDLDLIPTPGKNWGWEMEHNGYQIRVWDQRKIQGEAHLYVAQFRRGGRWLEMAPVRLSWENTAGDIQTVSPALVTGAPELDNDANTITWRDAFGPGIHFRYNLSSDKFFKTIIIDDFWNLPTPAIDPDGLSLTAEMRTIWPGSARAGNGFGQKGDEERKNPGKFSYKDQLDRDLWWMQEPKAWDSSEDRKPVDMDWRLRKKGNRISVLISISESALGGLAYPLYMDIVMAEESVPGSGYDAWSRGTSPTDGSSSFNSISVVGIVERHAQSGVTFTTVPIPSGATINSASLKVLHTVGNSSTVTNAKITAEDVDNPGIWTTGHRPGIGGVPGRGPETTAKVDWDSLWTPLFTLQTSPDISAITQELIDRPGWSSGQAMAYIIRDDGVGPHTRWFESFDAGGSDPPKFNATYDVAEVSQMIGPMFI